MPYGYDAFARLTSLGQNPTGTTNDLTLGFSYNPAGQIVTRTLSNPAYSYATTGEVGSLRNGLNQVTSIEGVPVVYDADQNATDVLGNAYGYDAVNRLTSATAAGGPGASGFTYDAYGRLITTTAGAATTRFQYAGQQLAAGPQACSRTHTVAGRRREHGPHCRHPERFMALPNMQAEK